jgi:glycosyltransferase involved in cell wall biosynthesis
MSPTPVASILIPTRGRPSYLNVALGSIVGQARSLGAEVLVVNDGGGPAVIAVAERHGARIVAAPVPGGVNIARNAGIAVAAADLIVLVDDDVRAPPGWLAALLAGVEAAPGSDAFGGPIRAVLEGGGPRSCGREGPPITSLDLGESDRDAELVWGANMALRRRALELAGPFDESLSGRGDEQEWELILRARGGTVRYVASAGLDHRRTAADSRLRRLAVAAYVQGREARRLDARQRSQPSMASELRTLVGCVWHVFRRRCLNGVVLAAHSAGRIREAVDAVASGDAGAPADAGDSGHAAAVADDGIVGDDFLSGTSGQVGGLRATARATTADVACDVAALVTLQPWRVRRRARMWPRRRVLVLAAEREDVPNVLAAARSELLSSHHEVRFESTPVGERGKFENLDLLLDRTPLNGFDWLLVLDDDVALPGGFLDGFVFLAERFDLAMAQPAHRWRSHAAWNVTRRRPFSLVRETAFVEIGPICALRAETFETLLPFPALRFGWGLDAHWSALAQARGWRQGVIDATPIQHGLRRIASSYDPADAIDEGRRFLADRPYTPAADANRTLVTHRGWS